MKFSAPSTSPNSNPFFFFFYEFAASSVEERLFFGVKEEILFSGEDDSRET